MQKKARGPRRASAIVSVCCIALALVIFPDSAGVLTAAQATGSPTTVTGPKMYNPATKSDFPNASSVTVDQTTNLVNQMVKVTWTGFTPSSNIPPSPMYRNDSTKYPVEVVECTGAQPADWTHCVGAGGGGVPASMTANGPQNTAYGLTAPDGTGQAYIHLFTGVDNQALGCDEKHPCSLAIIPAQGGNPFGHPQPVCTDHKFDLNVKMAAALSSFNWGKNSVGPCSWAKAIFVPLHFAPTPNDCGFRRADFDAGGSPMSARAMDQWAAGICHGSHPLNVQYSSELNEPLARDDFLNGTTDVAFTTRPVQGPGKHPYTYAPIDVSGVAVVYWIDDQTTGLPVTNLKLTPSLVAKLVTLSYGGGYGCNPLLPPPANGCDPGVMFNPVSILRDGEFLALNPGVNPPLNNQMFPLVGSGNSDLTYEVTRWVAGNSDASSFLAGAADNWGTHVNTYYKGVQYPTDVFASQDPRKWPEHGFAPVFPLSQVSARYMAASWDSGTFPDPDPLNKGNYPTFPAEVPGNRTMFAIVPLADAIAYQFPTAAILNGAGQFVQPTAKSVAAAMSTMTNNPDGITQYTNGRGGNPDAYPLTMVNYAMVPTGGVAKAKAAKIADFLRFAAGAGQTQGTSPGTLPDGFLPLTQAQRKQTLAAAKAVQEQKGAKPPGGNRHKGGTTDTPHRKLTNPKNNNNPSTPNNTGTGPAGNGKPGAPNNNKINGGGGTKANLPQVAPAATMGKRPDEAAAFTRFLLPALMIAGGLLVFGGPALLLVGRTAWGAELFDRIRNSEFVGRFTS